MLIGAGQAVRTEREQLEARACEAVRAWDKLEQAYERAGEQCDHQAQREIESAMERFAQDLKRDPSSTVCCASAALLAAIEAVPQLQATPATAFCGQSVAARR